MISLFIKSFVVVCISFVITTYASVAMAQTIGQTTSKSVSGWAGQGQSFTATVTGTVTEVRIRPNIGVVNDTLRFYNGIGSGVDEAFGAPIMSQTVTTTTTTNHEAPLQSFVLTTPLPVIAGNQYTFLFDTTVPRYGQDDYAGGNWVYRYNSTYDYDIAFQVVQVPQPVAVPTLSEWAMILFGTILVGGAVLYIRRRQFMTT